MFTKKEAKKTKVLIVFIKKKRIGEIKSLIRFFVPVTYFFEKKSNFRAIGIVLVFKSPLKTEYS